MLLSRNGARAHTMHSFTHAHLYVLPTATDDKIECYVDENGPTDNPNNIYKCSKTETCCTESGLPSCCREKPTGDAAWEQVRKGGHGGMLNVYGIFSYRVLIWVF